MPSPEQQREAERLAQVQVDLKQQYAQLEKHPAMLDLLETLDDSYDAAHNVALNEHDNATRAVAALQQANAYDKIRAYLHQMMG